MEDNKIIFQVKNEDKDYNKFILVRKIEKKDKETDKVNVFYGIKELLANKQVSIEYYNKLFKEGDFDNSFVKMKFKDIIEILKNSKIIQYINNNFEEFSKILK